MSQVSRQLDCCAQNLPPARDYELGEIRMCGICKADWEVVEAATDGKKTWCFWDHNQRKATRYMTDFSCCEEKAPYSHKGTPIGKIGDRLTFPCGHVARLEHGGDKLDWVYWDPTGYVLYCGVCKNYRNALAQDKCCGVESQYVRHTDAILDPNTPYDFARRTFSNYAALDAPTLPAEQGVKTSALQVQLHRWHVAQFDKNTLAGKAMGVSEEVGEGADALLQFMVPLLGLASASGKISHAILKNEDGIRGMGDEQAFRRKVADAVADAMIFSTQLCTSLRLDFGALYQATIEEVVKRDWKAEKERLKNQDFKRLVDAGLIDKDGNVQCNGEARR